MRFIAGEFLGLWGGFGIVYNTVWGGILTWIIGIILAALIIIGLCSVVKWVLIGISGAFKKRGESDGQYWLRTGKTKK